MFTKQVKMGLIALCISAGMAAQGTAQKRLIATVYQGTDGVWRPIPYGDESGIICDSNESVDCKGLGTPLNPGPFLPDRGYGTYVQK
jgi:hypothetical protein